MKFDWCEYFAIAEESLGSESPLKITDQGYNRNAISRAYYAAFNAARDYASVAYVDGNIHEYVISHFRDSSNITLSKIGTELDRLRSERNDADYKGRLYMNTSTAESAVESARSVLQLLGKI